MQGKRANLYRALVELIYSFSRCGDSSLLREVYPQAAEGVETVSLALAMAYALERDCKPISLGSNEGA
jgi:hypothetical protein